MLTMPLLDKDWTLVIAVLVLQPLSHDPVLDDTPFASFQNVHPPHVCICVAERTHTSVHKKRDKREKDKRAGKCESFG